MNFNIKRDEFLPLLQIVCSVIDRRQVLPILSNLLVVAEEEKITLTGTDMEVEMVVSIDHQAETPGEITVPARKLLGSEMFNITCSVLIDESASNK